jgi:hypothetical protein
MHSNSSHFHVPSCGCDPEEERQFQQMMRNKVQRDPAAAVRTLSTFQPPMGLLQAVANLVLTDHRIRRAGATSIFIQYITEGYVNPAEPLPDLSITASMDWETPLIGIINTLVAISKESAPLQSQDNEIRAELCRAYPGIIAVIWRDLSHLLPPGPSTDFRRRLVSQTMVNFVNIPNMKRFHLASSESPGSKSN